MAESQKSFSLNIHGRLLNVDHPIVMGIVNVDPKSFYKGSHALDDSSLFSRAEYMISSGATILDIGACSTRPGADLVSEDLEKERLKISLPFLRKHFPDVIISIDTFRSTVAQKAVEEWGADIVNDISGGLLDPKMASTVAQLKVPIILGHIWDNQDNFHTSRPSNNIVAEVIFDLMQRVDIFRQAGVSDIIIDPCFGFGKTIEDNFRLLDGLDEIKCIGLPLLIGISRKSMVWKTLGCSPEQALNGTTVMHTIAVLKGADILRVHDVAEAKEVISLIEMIKKNKHNV